MLATHLQAHIEPVRADVHALDQQHHDACLLGGEKFVPQRIELLECRASAGLGDSVVLRPRCLPRARDNLGLAEDGTQLVDDGGLDLAGRHAADGTHPRAALQHRLADIVAIKPPALAGVVR